MSATASLPLERIDEYRWRIPRHGDMRVDGIVVASEALMDEIREDQSLQQVANVAHLPGIVKASMAMPDIHWGYGFPIGGVAAMDPDEGVISPGGVGYDINCGVRLLRSRLDRADLDHDDIRAMTAEMFDRIPTGVGEGRQDLRLDPRRLRDVLEEGAAWVVGEGYGQQEDLDCIEERGCLSGADPDEISDRAFERGSNQLGTLGSGNHFAEIQYVAEIYDEEAADAFGLDRDQVAVMIHSGSRGFGHQVCTEFLKVMKRAVQKYDIELPDTQLCCAPLRSDEGERYLRAMAAAANYAFANRQVMTHMVRESFEQALQAAPRDLGVEVVYDVCHNIAKYEEFEIDGERRRLCVHRKGATRAYPAGHEQTPAPYREVGQPVLIPGDMGRYSYVLAGNPRAYEETFGSSCHGAGRRMSRTQAKKRARGRDLMDEMEQKGVVVMAAGMGTVAEEMPDAYKDVTDVVDVVEAADISRKVAQLRPLGVIKG